MKTLEELIKELGLKPSDTELLLGRCGNYVHICYDNTYTTLLTIAWEDDVKEVIEVKHEWI